MLRMPLDPRQRAIALTIDSQSFSQVGCHVDLAYAVTICDVPVLVQTATARAM